MERADVIETGVKALAGESYTEDPEDPTMAAFRTDVLTVLDATEPMIRDHERERLILVFQRPRGDLRQSRAELLDRLRSAVDARVGLVVPTDDNDLAAFGQRYAYRDVLDMINGIIGA